MSAWPWWRSEPEQAVTPTRDRDLVVRGAQHDLVGHLLHDDVRTATDEIRADVVAMVLHDRHRERRAGWQAQPDEPAVVEHDFRLERRRAGNAVVEIELVGRDADRTRVTCARA